MVATQTAKSEQNNALQEKNNEASITEAFLESVEEDHTMVDGMLQPTCVGVDSHPTLTLDELLPPAFMQTHTAAEDAEEYFVAYEVTCRADLLNLPSSVDMVVDDTTPFDHVRGLLRAALEFRLE